MIDVDKGPARRAVIVELDTALEQFEHQPDTSFRTIKAILFPSNEGAHRGAARFEDPAFTAHKE